MKILYAASEANPFAKSGGLADVAGALPKALVKDGVDARVIMPLYGDLKYRDKLEYVTNYSVPVGWRSQYCGLFKADVDGVTYYFLDNEYYFKRRGLYGFYDDGERFAFFSRAVLETLFYIDFTPDIINCNDWQTALVPVYLNLYYRHLDKFNRIKTIFTIHNIAYQGKYGTDILEDTCGIGRRDQHIVEYDGCANFMKGAFETADKITTVSPTYAQEILDPWFSYGLDALLREKQYKLCGILNGIDMEANNPATDPKIPFNYDVTNFEEGKAKCKEALQDKFGLHKDGRIAKIYISIMRGTPLMLQLLVVFYGPHYLFNIKLPYSYRFYAVIIGFALNYAAYFAEIYRSGIQSIPVGQREAAEVLGYGKAGTFFKIIFPQMVKRIMPPVTNEVITLVKDTSLAFAIAYTEMFTVAKQVSSSMASVMPLFVAGLFYYIFNFIVAYAMELIEKKFDYYR